MDLFGNTFKHSLFIIGNGFDLAHSMETSWGDFYKWLKTTKHFNLINFLEANHCCPEKFYHKVGCSTEPASGTQTGVVG